MKKTLLLAILLVFTGGVRVPKYNSPGESSEIRHCRGQGRRYGHDESQFETISGL